MKFPKLAALFRKAVLAFEDLVYSPQAPAPQVREILEKKGYKFETEYLVAPGGMGFATVTYLNIRTPSGSTVNFADPASPDCATYTLAYEAARTTTRQQPRPAP